MLDPFLTEGAPHLPYRELTREEDGHIGKQMYYFLPFVRQIYECLRKQESGVSSNPINVEVLNDIKELALYYGSGLVYGDFSLELQKLIENIFKNAGLPKEELKRQVLNITHNTFNKDDGNLEKYFFGDLPTDEVFSKDLPGGPLYSMGLGEGIAVFRQKDRFDLVQAFTNFAKADLSLPSISILGNVARGVIDAAALHAGLQRNSVKSEFNLYRASSQAMQDSQPHVINEKINSNSWGIAVDSFTAHGKSVPMSIKMMDNAGFKRKSVFLTHMGRHWIDELGVEFQWNHPHGEGGWAGTLLKGSFKR